jgi:hypothetical protein
MVVEIWNATMEPLTQRFIKFFLVTPILVSSRFSCFIVLAYLSRDMIALVCRIYSLLDQFCRFAHLN